MESAARSRLDEARHSPHGPVLLNVLSRSVKRDSGRPMATTATRPAARAGHSRRLRSRRRVLPGLDQSRRMRSGTCRSCCTMQAVPVESGIRPVKCNRMSEGKGRGKPATHLDTTGDAARISGVHAPDMLSGGRAATVSLALRTPARSATKQVKGPPYPFAGLARLTVGSGQPRSWSGTDCGSVRTRTRARVSPWDTSFRSALVRKHTEDVS
jgi:hypothetical protein